MVGAVGGSFSDYASRWAPARSREAEPSTVTGAPDSAAEAPDAIGSAQDESDQQEAVSSPRSRELTDEEKQSVRQLQQRDAEVRRHEAAHMAAGGGITGGASYEYQVGPDGRSYAVGGEVSISLSGGSTPQETIQKMQAVKAAALAPADPSGQDRAVAAAAQAQEAQARMEMAKESSGQGESTNPSSALEAYSGQASVMPGQQLDRPA